MPGRAVLAMTASTADPESKTTDRPSSKSVAVMRSGTAVSSMARTGRRVSTNVRQHRLEKNAPCRWRARRLCQGLSGKISRARASHHSRRSRSIWSGWGSAARYAALTAPIDVPTTMSGFTPSSSRAFSMPTWMLPRLAPPDRTNPIIWQLYPGRRPV